jgi:hypothetical protein
LPAIFGILNNTNLFILNCSHAIAEANNPIQGKKQQRTQLPNFRLLETKRFLDQSITLTLQDSLGSFELLGPFLFSSSFCLPFQELGINGGSTRSHTTRGHIKNYSLH